MERFKSYDVDDFLSDPDFREWVRRGAPNSHPVWGQLLIVFPEKAGPYRHAIELMEEVLGDHLQLPPTEVDHEVRRILTSTRTPAYPNIPKRWYWAAAVVLAAGLFWFQSPKNEPIPFDFQALKEIPKTHKTIDRHNASSDSIHSFWLPDGSLAQLYPGARLRYVLDELSEKKPTKPKREVYMTGDIFFDVVSDASRPFVVYSDDFMTQVVGTSFIVRSSGDEASVEVKSGKVVVRTFMVAQETQFELTPNQKLTYSAQVNQLIKDLSPEPAVLDEVEELITFDFDHAAVQDVFERLEQAYGIPIHFDKEKLNNCFLSVTMGDEPFFTKLDIICRTLGADFTIADGAVTIYGEPCY